MTGGSLGEMICESEVDVLVVLLPVSAEGVLMAGADVVD
jgi:hypothetical protein